MIYTNVQKGDEKMNLINILKIIVKKEDDKLDFEKIAMEWLLKKKIGIKESTYAKYEYMIN